MSIKVDDNTIQETTKCGKNFSCLSGEMPSCSIEENIDNKIHFIKCVNNELCSYKLSFGYSYVCTCPVRKELYNNYKI